MPNNFDISINRFIDLIVRVQYRHDNADNFGRYTIRFINLIIFRRKEYLYYLDFLVDNSDFS